jgi:hypothetical protein
VQPRASATLLAVTVAAVAAISERRSKVVMDGEPPCSRMQLERLLAGF